MTWWQAVIMGIVQGLTEFLPVSSTAHLRVTPAVCGFADPGAGFTAIIQLGTLAAVLWYFWRDITELAVGWLRGLVTLRPFGTVIARQGWFIILATIPIVLCGYFGKSLISDDPEQGHTAPLRTLTAVSLQLIAGSIIMCLSEIAHLWYRQRETPFKELPQLGLLDTLGVGLFQCLALMPGMSRSGMTISGGLFLGLSRETAARFSFLLSLPAIFAAAVYSGYKDFLKPHLATGTPIWELGQTGVVGPTGLIGLTEIAIATVVSGIVGYAAIAFLLEYLKRNSVAIFIIYRLILASLLLLALKQNWLISH
ncbi:MAG: undecaprenyl-diphosphatase UppP [Pirellulales bacterium]|nr:undecaprenyl-diphosphatase UppP [Pirellulales bacterium]